MMCVKVPIIIDPILASIVKYIAIPGAHYCKSFSSQGFLSEHYLQCSGWHCAGGCILHHLAIVCIRYM